MKKKSTLNVYTLQLTTPAVNMPKTCPKPRRTPCDGAWPYEKDNCCYKKAPTSGSTSRKAPAATRTRKSTARAMSTESMAARKITQAAMRRASSGPTVADLRARAKAMKIKGYSKMTKTQLMNALSSGPSSSGAAAASPLRTASISKKAASPKAKTSGNASSSKPMHDFIQETWQSLYTKDGLFPNNVELGKPVLDFLVQKLNRLIKHFSKIKNYGTFKRALRRLQYHGLGVTDRELKKKFKETALMGYGMNPVGPTGSVFRDVDRTESLIDSHRYRDNQLRQVLMSEFDIRPKFLEYVDSMFPGLNGSKNKNLVIFLFIVLIQSSIRTLQSASVKTTSKNGVPKITLTEESIKKGMMENTDIAVFFS